MKNLRYEENRKAVQKRRQEQPRATLYRKMLISWSSGIENVCFLYRMKPKAVRFIVKSKYWNSEMKNLRYEENREAVSERRQEQ